MDLFKLEARNKFAVACDRAMFTCIKSTLQAMEVQDPATYSIYTPQVRDLSAIFSEALMSGFFDT